MTHEVHAIYDQGVFRPLEPLVLPEGLSVHLRIEVDERQPAAAPVRAHVYSPRLAHPEQAADFQMEIEDLPNAGL